MTREEYRKTALDLAYLAACALRGTAPEGARVRAMDVDLLYRTASRHLLTAITAAALEAAGVRDPRFAQELAKAIRKVLLMDRERKAVLERLEQAGIWYMPLKGSVLKELYPAIGMRQMADNDILYDAARSEDVRAIMEALGFTTEHFGTGNHDVYYKPPVCNFELHSGLFGPGHEKLYRYYREVKGRLLRDGDSQYGYHFSPEDFYLYLTAHEYKHYSGGGTGLRSLLDTYVYWNHWGEGLDRDYLAGELRQLGLTEFERRNRTLALDLFQGRQLSGWEEEMLDYILSSGAYGTVEHRVTNQLTRSGGRLPYLFRRLFPPMELVRASFPFFARHRILLPLLPFYRLGRVLVRNRAGFLAECRLLLRRRGKDSASK